MRTPWVGITGRVTARGVQFQTCRQVHLKLRRAGLRAGAVRLSPLGRPRALAGVGTAAPPFRQPPLRMMPAGRRVAVSH